MFDYDELDYPEKEMRESDAPMTVNYRADIIFNLKPGDARNEEFPQIINNILKEVKEEYLEYCRSGNGYFGPSFSENSDGTMCDIDRIDDNSYRVIFEVEDVSAENSIDYMRDGNYKVTGFGYDGVLDNADATFFDKIINSKYAPEIESIKYDTSDSFFYGLSYEDANGDLVDASEDIVNSILPDEFGDRSVYLIEGLDGTKNIVTKRNCKNYYDNYLHKYAKENDIRKIDISLEAEKEIQDNLATNLKAAIKDGNSGQVIDNIKILTGAYLDGAIYEEDIKKYDIKELNDFVEKLDFDIEEHILDVDLEADIEP